MTQPVQALFNESVANGATTVFAYQFQIDDPRDLLVLVNGSVSSGYTIQDLGQVTGGTITYAVAPANGALVSRRRNTVNDRVNNFGFDYPFQAEQVNAELDRIWQGMQLLEHNVRRALKIPFNDVTNQTIAGDAVARAGKMVGFDADGNMSISMMDLSTFEADVAAAIAARNQAVAARDETEDLRDETIVLRNAADLSADEAAASALSALTYKNQASTQATNAAASAAAAVVTYNAVVALESSASSAATYANGRAIDAANSATAAAISAAAFNSTVKVSANDTGGGFLNGKLVAGTGVTLTENNDGSFETLTISAGGTDNKKFLISATDTTDNYALSKLVAGANMILTKLNPGGNEQLEFAAAVSTASVTAASKSAAVSATDTTPNFLQNKLAAGTGITLTKSGAGNETLTIASTSSDTKQVKISAGDTTEGYVFGKLVAGTSISFTQNNVGGNETLTIAVTGGVTDTKQSLVSATDTTEGYLVAKVLAGANMTVTKSAAGNETLTLAAAVSTASVTAASQTSRVSATDTTPDGLQNKILAGTGITVTKSAAGNETLTIASTVADNKQVRISAGDTTDGYVGAKLVAGSNITLTKNNSGSNETLTIAATASTGTLAKVSSNDTTGGYLNGKLVAGTGVTFTENNDGSNETLTIAASGGGGGISDYINLLGSITQSPTAGAASSGNCYFNTNGPANGISSTNGTAPVVTLTNTGVYEVTIQWFVKDATSSGTPGVITNVAGSGSSNGGAFGYAVATGVGGGSHTRLFTADASNLVISPTMGLQWNNTTGSTQTIQMTCTITIKKIA